MTVEGEVGDLLFKIVNSDGDIKEAKSMKSNINRIRKYFKTMTEGEKIYLANKLYKEDGIVAQKVRKYIPEPVPEPEFKKGDLVRYQRGLGVVVEVDKEDALYTYRIDYGSGGLWVLTENISAYSE